MEYKDWLSKHKGMKSTAANAQKFYKATGREMPESVAARVDRADRKDAYRQWLDAKGVQSSAAAGAVYRQKELGQGMTDKQKTQFNSPVPMPNMSDGGRAATDADMQRRASEAFMEQRKQRANSPVNRLRGR